MKDAIALFSELGVRLRRFGEDIRSRQAIERACRANGWFSPEEIRRAVMALIQRMLQPELLAAWLAHYPAPAVAPQRVLVVMAGNIPLVGFFDLLCVIASGNRCLIKPSAKDTVLMEYLVELLREIDPRVPLAFYDGQEVIDAVIATGSDNAARYFRTLYTGIPALLRGHRQSVAVLSGTETEAQMEGLADDIWAYSGLGCRNVSMILAPESLKVRLRMKAVNYKYINNYKQEKVLLAMTGQPYEDLGGALLVEQREFPVSLSRIALWRYRTMDEVRSWLAEHDAELQCVVSESVTHGRRVGFGEAQFPSLTDYPDERDVMAFLVGLNG